MRIYLMLLGAFFLASLNVFAQEELPKVKVKTPKIKASKESMEDVSPAGTSRFLIKVYGGYGFATGNTYNYFSDAGTSADNFVETFSDANNPSQTRVVVKENTRGLGTAARVGLGIAYIVNDYVNLGVDVDYYNSKISRSRRDVAISLASTTVPALTTTKLSDFSYDADIIAVSPNIVFKAITRNNVYVYTRLGMTLSPFYKLERLDKTSIKVTTPSAAVVKDSSILKRYDVDLKFPIGFFASFGANFKLSGRMRLFVEGQYTSIIFTPKTRTVVEYSENGKDLLGELASRKQYRQEVFTKEFNVPLATLANNPNYTVPREIPAVRIPVTNFSVLAGVTYRF